MNKIYANRIMTSNGAFTINDVPQKNREAVIKILIEKGYEVEE